MLIRYWCLIIMLLTAVFQPAFTQENGAIQGVVLNQDGQVLPYVSIHIGAMVTTSDADGVFEFKNLSAGTHLLKATAVGYKTRIDTIYKHASERIFVEINLIVEAQSIDEVQITGFSEARQVADRPIRTLVIDTRAASTQATSLTDLMNNGSGIRVRQNGGLGSQPEISINGFQGKAIKYFKDGIPLDYLGEGYQLSSLPLEALERVEVYKGVLPISLGADALGGAVNLVSKKTKGPSLSIFYQIGSFNTHRFGVSASKTSKNQAWVYGGDLFLNYSDNNYTAKVDVVNPETKNIESHRLPLFHNGFKNYYGEVYIALREQNWVDELRLSLSNFALEREQQHPALLSDVYGQVHAKQKSMVPTLRYKKSFLEGKIAVDQFASYNNLNTKRIDTLQGKYDWFGNFTPGNSLGESRLPSLSDINQKQFLSRTNIRYNSSANSSFSLNYVFTDAKRSGTDPYGPRLADTDIDVLSLPSTYQKHVLGASLDQYWASSTWHNQLMAKLYHYNAKGMQNTWFSTDVSQLDERSITGNYWGIADAIKYQIDKDMFLRGSIEYAYRLPERDELFGNQVFIVPNFELNPENSLNVNLGYQYHYQQAFKAEINGFYRRTTNLILLVPIQAPNAQYQNQEHVKGYGFDVDLSYELLKNVRLSANASWQNLRLFGITAFQDQWKNNARLRNTPYFFANTAIQTKHKNLFSNLDELRVFLNYNFLREFYLETIPKAMEPGGFLGLHGSASLNSDLVIPNQHILSLGATYSFAKLPIQLGAELQNILDNDLFDYYRIPRPGRGFNIKISYQLY